MEMEKNTNKNAHTFISDLLISMHKFNMIGVRIARYSDNTWKDITLALSLLACQHSTQIGRTFSNNGLSTN